MTRKEFKKREAMVCNLLARLYNLTEMAIDCGEQRTGRLTLDEASVELVTWIVDQMYPEKKGKV